MDYRMLKILEQLEKEGGVWDDPREMYQALTSTEESDNPNFTPPEYKNKSRKFPSFSNSNLKSFVDRTTENIQKLHQKSNKSNLTSTQRLALKRIKARQDKIIKPSDKAGNLVIQTTEDYMAMCHKILEDPNFMDPRFPTGIFQNHRWNFLQKFNF